MLLGLSTATERRGTRGLGVEIEHVCVLVCGGVAYYYQPTPEGRPREAARALGGAKKD